MTSTTLDKLRAEGWPREPIGLDQWKSLPEDELLRLECVEGMVQMAASPIPIHQWVITRLLETLAHALGPDLVTIPDVDVLLVTEPLTVRRPDVVVADRAVLTGPHPMSVSAVHLVVEVTSPGSGRVDRVFKRADYADAGIAEYWIVDLDDHTITTQTLEGASYGPPSVHGGPATLAACGVAIAIDVDALTTV